VTCREKTDRRAPSSARRGIEISEGEDRAVARVPARHYGSPPGAVLTVPRGHGGIFNELRSSTPTHPGTRVSAKVDVNVNDAQHRDPELARELRPTIRCDVCGTARTGYDDTHPGK